jgi:hypothetical protein
MAWEFNGLGYFEIILRKNQKFTKIQHCQPGGKLVGWTTAKARGRVLFQKAQR